MFGEYKDLSRVAGYQHKRMFQRAWTVLVNLHLPNVRYTGLELHAPMYICR